MIALPSPTIVFDLDGTLVDTAPDLAATLNVVLTRHRIPPVTLDFVRPLIGHGAAALIEKGLREALVGVGDAQLKGMLVEFLEHYEANIAVDSRPFDGVVAALERFQSDGYRLAVCTNKRENLSKKLLDTLDISSFFAAIAGPDTFHVQKPDPQHILKTLGAAGGHAARAVMIGDSKNDILAAQAAGIPVIAVDFGYTPEPVSKFKPDHIVSHYDEIVPLVRAAFAESA